MEVKEGGGNYMYFAAVLLKANLSQAESIVRSRGKRQCAVLIKFPWSDEFWLLVLSGCKKALPIFPTCSASFWLSLAASSIHFCNSLPLFTTLQEVVEQNIAKDNPSPSRVHVLLVLL